GGRKASTRGLRDRCPRARRRCIWSSGISSVVILLLRGRHLEALVDYRLFAALIAARSGFRGGVAALVAATDLLLRVQSLEHEVDRRRDHRSGRAAFEAG